VTGGGESTSPAAASHAARSDGSASRSWAAAFAALGVALAACGLLLDHGRLGPAAIAAAGAGCAGPLVTGGLSTQSVSPAAAPHGQRRAEALDSATYGVGSTLGPLAVTGALLVLSPLAAVVALGAVALGAAAGALFLPAASAAAPRARLPLRRAAAAIAGVAPLRRVLAATTIAALGSGGLLVVAVAFGARLAGHATGGAMLAGAYGAGSLAGSLVLAARPLRTEPEATTITLTALAGASVALCALAPGQAVAVILFTLAGGASSAQFTASLAVRSAYAPRGTRAHVYATMAGLKLGCAAVGAALASTMLALGPRPALLGIAGFIVIGALAAALMRHTSAARPRRPKTTRPRPQPRPPGEGTEGADLVTDVAASRRPAQSGEGAG
jgi:hypothetical protein